MERKRESVERKGKERKDTGRGGEKKREKKKASFKDVPVTSVTSRAEQISQAKGWHRGN